MQEGDVSNNGTSDVDYVTSIAQHTAKPGTGFFTNGATAGTKYADFDASYQPINGLNYDGSSSRYTVQYGDTLESIAQKIWGDGNFWYLIADANGLSGDSQLIAGEDLIIPNKVANNSNNAGTYRVYNPNDALGNTAPTHPPKPQHQGNNCGVFGQILIMVIAVAVSIATFNPLVGFAGASLGLGAGTAAATIVGGALAGITGSVASQAFGLATGIQSKFSWADVGLAAIGGAVGGAVAPGGLFEGGAFSGLSDSIGEFGVGALRGITTSIVDQGIGVATGLQSKFDWAGVAAAGISSGVMGALSDSDWVKSTVGDAVGDDPKLQLQGRAFVAGMAGGIAGAAARSLITGSDFGDNILKGLPTVIGSTIGNAIEGEIDSAADQQQGGATTAQSASDVALSSSADGAPVTAFDAQHRFYRYIADPADAGGADGIEQVTVTPMQTGNPIEEVVVTASRLPGNGIFDQYAYGSLLGSNTDFDNIVNGQIRSLSKLYAPPASYGTQKVQFGNGSLSSALRDTGRAGWNALVDLGDLAVTGATMGLAPTMGMTPGNYLRANYETPVFGYTAEALIGIGAGGIGDLAELNEATETISFFRKMSSGEADLTLGDLKLQPPIAGSDSSKYLSSSLNKVIDFQKSASTDAEKSILEFVLDKQGYDDLMASSVPQYGSSGLDAVKYHYEGLDPLGPDLNIGVPPTQLGQFNSIILDIRRVPR